ncbi:CNNM domain-containing protein [Streptomyces sp. NPDC007325]|uniref:CNNM domain-containing protein n=1 Tax=Streptomyces sp. NPDC007325 TaxID=3154588 RepID=UPI0033C609F1
MPSSSRPSSPSPPSNAASWTEVLLLLLALALAFACITVTSLVIGVLAGPSLAAPLRGPLEAIGLGAAAPSAATVLGVALSTVVLMVVAELVPKNWAISRPPAVAKVVADTPLDDTLTALRAAGSHLAAGTAGPGTVLGHVTMEDVLEEPVGPATV